MCLKKEAACEQPLKQHLPSLIFFISHIGEMKLIFIVYFLCVLLECKLCEKRDFLFLAYLCIFSALYKNEYLLTKRMYNKQKNKLSQFMSLLLTSPNQLRSTTSAASLQQFHQYPFHFLIFLIYSAMLSWQNPISLSIHTLHTHAPSLVSIFLHLFSCC